MRTGTALTQLVEFSSGPPDGNVTWQLLNSRGVQLASGFVVPVVGSASTVITLTAAQNTIEVGALSSPRELNWSYMVGGIAQNGRRRYRLEAFLPFGVSEEGVRRKLGVEVHELGDEAIDLVGSYGRFRETVGATALTAVEVAGGHGELLVGDAIEALAAINLIPSLQISLAARESSGTNQFQRAAIKWDAIRAQLDLYVAEGVNAVTPVSSTTDNFGPLLMVVVRDDPVTGALA